MNGLFETDAAQLCLSIMDKLNDGGIGSTDIEEILTEICTYFDFSYGFIYHQSDYNNFLSNLVSMEKQQNIIMPDKLELNDKLGRKFLNALSKQKMVICAQGNPETKLNKQIEDLTNLGTFILVPVMDENKQVIMMMGLGDKEKDKRLEDLNQFAIYSTLVIVLNHMKVWHYLDRIERTEKALDSIATNMGVDIYVNDFDNHDILYVNESMAAPYGGPEAMIGKKCWKSLYDDKTGQCEYCPQKKLIDKDGKPTKIYSWDYQRPFDKSWFRVLSAAFRWEDGRMAHIVSSIDITEHKKKEELISVIAEYDTLTRLFNRRKLVADGKELLKSSRETKSTFYVLFFDLNKFKQVNDQYGHREGDELLIQIGEYLQKYELTKNRSYRYGGDEFVVLLEKHTRTEVIQIAEALQKRFSKPWKLKSCDAVCYASIGIAEYPFSGEDMEALLNSADEAMYESKRFDGKEIVFHKKMI